jgi:hypothetical protein
MRHLLPVEIHALRSYYGRRVAAPQPTPQQPRISAAHKRVIVDAVAEILKRGEPTRFAFEGVCRHGIRSSLCLQGWRWALADRVADDVVSAALDRIGAVRPLWKEAQPEWTQDGHVPIDRLLCRQCSRRLPEHGSSHMIFCSSQCRTAWHSAIYRRARRAEITAAREAGHAA